MGVSGTSSVFSKNSGRTGFSAHLKKTPTITLWLYLSHKPSEKYTHRPDCIVILPYSLPSYPLLKFAHWLRIYNSGEEQSGRRLHLSLSVKPFLPVFIFCTLIVHESQLCSDCWTGQYLHRHSNSVISKKGYALSLSSAHQELEIIVNVEDWCVIDQVTETCLSLFWRIRK